MKEPQRRRFSVIVTFRLSSGFKRCHDCEGRTTPGLDLYSFRNINLKGVSIAVSPERKLRIYRKNVALSRGFTLLAKVSRKTAEDIKLRKHLNAEALIKTMHTGFAGTRDHRTDNVPHNLMTIYAWTVFPVIPQCGKFLTRSSLMVSNHCSRMSFGNCSVVISWRNLSL